MPRPLGTAAGRPRELHLNGEPITQVTTLDKAAARVRDYLDTVEPDIDHADVDVTVLPDLGDSASR